MLDNGGDDRQVASKYWRERPFVVPIKFEVNIIGQSIAISKLESTT